MAELRTPLQDDRRYFCIVHSDRPAQLDQCDLNYLERRYSRPDRLPPRETFETLPAAATFTSFGGEITIHDLGESRFEPPRLVARMRPDQYKPQHAIWRAGRLWVVGVDRIEIYDRRLDPVARIDDPWLAGGHTIFPDGKGRMLVSCSSSDSVLVIDQATLSVIGAHRMPESLYGHNYALKRTDSVVDHYISNDAQLTHINCAYPWRDGILTSCLIHGAIGWFDSEGRYEELLRGFVGCHGGRVNTSGEIYFCDSALGALTIVDSRMRISQRIGTGSRWLHDATQIHGTLYALALYDRQQVWFIDSVTRETVCVLDCGPFGSPQFLGY
jgi:hypothetical protein